MIVIAGTVPIHPERHAEAVQVALRMAAATEAEAGCISYRLYSDVGDPNTWLIFEQWENEEALLRHFQTPHMAEFRRQLPKYVTGPATIKRYTVEAVTDL